MSHTQNFTHYSPLPPPLSPPDGFVTRAGVLARFGWSQPILDAAHAIAFPRFDRLTGNRVVRGRVQVESVARADYIERWLAAFRPLAVSAPLRVPGAGPSPGSWCDSRELITLWGWTGADLGTARHTLNFPTVYKSGRVQRHLLAPWCENFSRVALTGQVR